MDHDRCDLDVWRELNAGDTPGKIANGPLDLPKPPWYDISMIQNDCWISSTVLVVNWRKIASLTMSARVKHF